MFEYIIKKEDIDTEIVLILKPESAISITTYKGLFSKTSIKPTNSNIMGLLENILGIHFDENMRKKIISQHKLNPYKRKDSKLFISLLDSKVEILDIIIPKNFEKFIDSYSYLMKRIGERSHIKGIKNCDITLTHHKKVDLVKIGQKEKMPRYYTSIYKREYFVTDDVYKIKIKTSQSIKNELLKSLDEKDSYFLGNSDGVISVKIL